MYTSPEPKAAMSKMRKLLALLLWVAALVLTSWLLMAWLGTPRFWYADDVAQVEREGERLREYRRTHGHFPSPSEWPLALGRISYDLGPDGGVMLGFSVGFDENYFYDIDTGRWSFEAPAEGTR